MVQEKGYKLDKSTLDKCYGIFKEACTKPEFGNGRFARNLLEQAMMRQADRLVRSEGIKSFNRKELMTLIADDFNVNVGKCSKKEEKIIGFAS